DALKLVDLPDPHPGPGEVLLRMKAASLNYRDLVVARRGYGERTGRLPLVPVSDGVGEVLEAGPDVTRVAAGDRVCPSFFQSWIAGEATAERLAAPLGGPLHGVMSQYRVLSEQG